MSSLTNKVIVTQSTQKVIVQPNVVAVEPDSIDNIVTVEPNSYSVTVATPGPQGAPGTLGSDAYFEQDFSSASTIIVDHNLNKYPAVTVIVGGVEVEADITYNSLDQVTVDVGSPNTGKIVCD